MVRYFGCLLLYEDNIYGFYEGLYPVALPEARFFKTFSRHHGREPDRVVVSGAAHLYLRHDLVAPDFFYLSYELVSYSGFHVFSSFEF